MKRIIFIISLFLSFHVQSQMVINSYQFGGGAGFTPDTIQVNIYDSVDAIGKFTSKVAPDFWNQWSINLTNATTANLYSTYLKFRNGTTSTVRVKYPTQSGTPDYYSNNASTYGAGLPNATSFPDSAFWVPTFKTYTPSTLTISGLVGATYTIEVLCSRAAGTTRNMTVSYGAISSGTFDANNRNALVVLTGCVPSSGEIALTITMSNSFGYVNAIRIIRTS